MKIELYSECLAKRVYERASEIQKAQRRATRLVRDRFNAWRNNPHRLLPEVDLIYLQTYGQNLDLSPEELAFVQHSQISLRRKKRRRWVLALSLSFATFAFLLHETWNKHDQAQSAFYNLQYAEANNQSLQDSIQNLRRMSVQTSPPVLHWNAYRLQALILNAQGLPLNQVEIQIHGHNYQTNPKGQVEIQLICPATYRDTLSVYLYKQGFKDQEIRLSVDDLLSQQTWILSQ